MKKHRSKKTNAPPARKSPCIKRFQKVLSYTSYEIRCSKFGQDAFDRSLAPLVLSARRFDAQLRQLVSNGVVGQPRKELAVNEPDGLGFFLVDHQVSVLASVVTDEPAEGNRHLAVRHALPMPPGDVFRNAPAFLLREAAHDRDEQFAFGIERPDVFLLEKDLGVVLLQLPDGRKAVHGVSGETADAFRDDQVDFPIQRVRHHFLKAFTFFDAGAGNAFVRAAFLSGTFLRPYFRPFSTFLPIWGIKKASFAMSDASMD